MRKEPVWSEVRSEFINEEGFLCIDAWKTADDDEVGKVIAYIDTLGGRIIYVDPVARVDENAQEIIQAKSKEYQKEHPFNVEELETLAKGVVGFESEGSPIDGRRKRQSPPRTTSQSADLQLMPVPKRQGLQLRPVRFLQHRKPVFHSRYQNLEEMGFSQAEMKFFGFDVDGALKELESEYEGGEE